MGMDKDMDKDMTGMGMGMGMGMDVAGCVQCMFDLVAASGVADF